MGETKKDRIQLLVRRFFLFLTDTFLLNACVYLSLIMRFDVGIVSIEPQYISNYVENMLPYTIMSLLIFWLFRLYHSLWQYASIAEVYRIAEACIIVEVVHLRVICFLEAVILMRQYTLLLQYVQVVLCTE